MNSNFRTVPFADTDPRATNEIVRANTMLEDIVHYSGSQNALMNDQASLVRAGSTNHSCKQFCDCPEHFDKYV